MTVSVLIKTIILRILGLGGLLSSTQVNAIIAEAHEFLAKRYVDENHFENFPSLHSSFMAVSQFKLTNDEVERLVEVFALHELGTISPTYAEALHTLSQRYKLAAVIDIWAPKAIGQKVFPQQGLQNYLIAWFSLSDQRMVKPSPKNFQLALSKLGLSPDQVIMVGDSARRDLGGAKRAGIECVLVGVERDPSAFMHFETLLEFVDSVLSVHTP